MVNRNRTIVRTPRRRKVWAQRETSIVLGAGTTTPKVDDLLDPFFTDLGVNTISGLTLMRMFGTFSLKHWIASPATATSAADIRLGITWMDKVAITAGDGSGLIPEPLLDGSRETNFIQQWLLNAVEPPVSAPIITSAPLDPIERSYVEFDVTQQRRQPTAQSSLGLVISGGSTYETNVVALGVNVSMLLALP